MKDITRIHVHLNITINENDYDWYSPSATDSIEYSIPASVFDSKQIAKLADEIVNGLKEAFPVAKKEYEREHEKEIEKLREQEKNNEDI